ncbi:MAG TPA: APC family permease [Micromonosporaceae bacterium]|nr:APC family permease [Micromonosporaceae bacterium]
MALESTIQGGLASRRLGVGSLVFFTVAASAPMTVLAGGVVATFAVSGVVGVPLAFPVIAAALALFAVGYAAMSRYVFNAGALYSYISQGLGRSWGVSGSLVALLGYNAIQIGLYGLWGFAVDIFMQSHFNVAWPWWLWALLAWVAVGILGLLKIDLNAKVLSVLLIAEVIAVLLYDVAAFTHPAGGSISTAALTPDSLFVNGIGAVFALTIAAFVGFEQAAVYAEEARDPRRTVARATYITVAITAVLYFISAWAMTVASGPENVIADAQNPESGIPFSTLAVHYGDTVATIANVLLITSVFAALLSFHNGVARYLFALGRERVLPPVLGQTGRTSSAPTAGSIVQTVIAAVVLAVFIGLRLDPLTQLFTWLSYVAAVAVLLLMIGTSAAVIGFFQRRRNVEENAWQRLVAPILAIVALGAITWVTVQNSSSVLGAEEGSALVWLLPASVFLAAALGLLWGVVLKKTKPEIYQGVGFAGDLNAADVHDPGLHDPASSRGKSRHRPDSQMRV